MKPIYFIATLCTLVTILECHPKAANIVINNRITIRVPNLNQEKSTKIYCENSEITSGSSILKTVPCTLSVVIDTITKYEIVITSGIQFIDTIDIWLYDLTTLINCASDYKQLRGKVYNNDGTEKSGMRVQSSNTTRFTRTRDDGSFQLCMPSENLNYTYIESGRNNNIDIRITNLSDPDLRIDVYLSDADKDNNGQVKCQENQ